MSTLPHVTAVLAECGLIDATWFKDYDMERGTATHKACEYLDQDDLQIDSLDDAVMRRVTQYQRFKNEMRPEILAIEADVRHASLSYVGRLDRVVRLSSVVGILDIKGPSQAPWTGLQTCAYLRAWNSDAVANPTALRRWSLHLSDDNYKLVEHTSRRDWPAFQAALTLYRWKENHGCLKKSS